MRCGVGKDWEDRNKAVKMRARSLPTQNSSLSVVFFLPKTWKSCDLEKNSQQVALLASGSTGQEDPVWVRVLCQDRARVQVDSWGPGVGNHTEGHNQVQSVGSKLYANATASGGTTGHSVALGLPC